MVTNINRTNYTETLEQEGAVIVDFWAPWCGPCRMMAPVFEELSTEYKGKLDFAKLNTEDHPELAMNHEIMGIPTLVVFKNGAEIGRISGFGPKPVLKQHIDAILAKGAAQ